MYVPLMNDLLRPSRRSGEAFDDVISSTSRFRGLRPFESRFILVNQRVDAHSFPSY